MDDCGMYPYGLTAPWADKKKEVSEHKLQLLIESIRVLPCTTQRCKNASPGWVSACHRCQALEQAEAL